MKGAKIFRDSIEEAKRRRTRKSTEEWKMHSRSRIVRIEEKKTESTKIRWTDFSRALGTQIDTKSVQTYTTGLSTMMIKLTMKDDPWSIILQCFVSLYIPTLLSFTNCELVLNKKCSQLDSVCVYICVGGWGVTSIFFKFNTSDSSGLLCLIFFYMALERRWCINAFVSISF